MTTARDGKIFFDDRPLTGVVFRLAGSGPSGEVSSENLVVDGIEIGEDDRWGVGVRRYIDANSSSREEGLLRVGGEPFSGIVYEFDEEGRLAFETECRDGSFDGDLYSWYPSGGLSEFRRESEHGSIGESWHESGGLNGITRESLYAAYNESGGLYSLWLGDGFDPRELRRLSLYVCETLELRNFGITDQIVAKLSGLQGVTSLSLRDTSVTAAGLAAFGVCPLTALYTRGNSEIDEGDIRELLTVRPNCHWFDQDAND